MVCQARVLFVCQAHTHTHTHLLPPTPTQGVVASPERLWGVGGRAKGSGKKRGAVTAEAFEFRNLPGVALGTRSPRVDSVALVAAAQAATLNAPPTKQTPQQAVETRQMLQVAPASHCLPGSVLALKTERDIYKVEHSVSVASKEVGQSEAPPSWRRQGVTKYSGEFLRASGLPVPPNFSDSRKRLSGLSVYSLADAVRGATERGGDLWGFDPSLGVMLTRTSVGEVVTGGWRDRERGKEREVAAEALRAQALRTGVGGGRDRSNDRDEQVFERERQRVIAREKGQQRWAKTPSNGGVPSASAAALDDYLTTALKVLPRRSSPAGEGRFIHN